MPINRICLECGTPFIARHDGIRKWCSKECQVQYTVKRRLAGNFGHREQRKIECAQCHKVFSVPIGKGDRKYCSRACVAESKHLTAKRRKCKTCGNLFIPSVHGSVTYCSEDCKPKQPTACAFCGGDMPEQRSFKIDKYCSVTCKKDALRQRTNKKRAGKTIERRAKNRKQVAGALCMYRSGTVLMDIEDAIGWKQGTASGILARYSRIYRKMTGKKKSQSRWHQKEVRYNARSSMFRKESDFRKYAAMIMARIFTDVNQEVGIPGTRRRIDLVVSDGLFRFGIELKNGNRTARLDQTLGQALIKCAALNLIPVCIVPDDVQPDKVFLHGCARYSVLSGTLTNVIDQMRLTCGKSLAISPLGSLEKK